MKGGIIMMKWKARKETLNVGIMELDNLTFNEDYLEVNIDILDMSEELKAEVNKAIEIEKVRYSEEWDEILLDHEEFKRFSTKWSDKPVVIEYNSLSVTLEAGKPIKYTIYTGFHDVDNDRLEPVCSINVDLSAHTEELKKAIIHVLIDRFF